MNKTRVANWCWWVLTGALTVSLGGACGGGGSGGPGGASSISSEPLKGTINGKAWTLVAGETDAFLSKDGDTFFANLYDQPVDTACGGDPAGAKQLLILNIPKTVGHYTLSLDLNQTFAYDDGTGTGTFQNDIATSGQLDVTSVTSTKILGGVKMSYGSKNSVDGQFEIAICP